MSGSDHAGRAERDLADREQSAADGDQTAADLDQTAADLDQTLADTDEGAAARDQRASDSDQESADRDQAISDNGSASETDPVAYARSQRARSETTLERDIAAHVRSEGARIRDANASRRDVVAERRDAAARERDQLATALDDEIGRLEGESLTGADGRPVVGIELLLRAASDRKRAEQSRIRAAAQRDAAAMDREQAARDREQARIDRQAAAEELATEGLDHLTGALRRRIGLTAIQREIDRTARTDEPLVVAFVDVDGLKAVNDRQGHQAGDEMLRDVVRSIMEAVRSYDVVARYGGDEFVCSLAGQDADGAQERFGRISARLAEKRGAPTITVGFAECRPGETLEELIARSDAAVVRARARR